MNEFGCIAHLDECIRAQVNNRTIKTGKIGEWENSKAEVIINGILLTTGMFPRWCIRWTSPQYNNRGLFGKGLSGYVGEPFEYENLKHLPVVK